MNITYIFFIQTNLKFSIFIPNKTSRAFDLRYFYLAYCSNTYKFSIFSFYRNKNFLIFEMLVNKNV